MKMMGIIFSNIYDEHLGEITKERTLVIFVDELDRCLPEYAIKVLERMHHISKKVQNLQIIYSIDKNQFKETVRNIFGQNVNAGDYLKKFFGFGINISSVNLYFDSFFIVF